MHKAGERLRPYRIPQKNIVINFMKILQVKEDACSTRSNDYWRLYVDICFYNKLLYRGQTIYNSTKKHFSSNVLHIKEFKFFKEKKNVNFYFTLKKNFMLHTIIIKYESSIILKACKKFRVSMVIYVGKYKEKKKNLMWNNIL